LNFSSKVVLAVITLNVLFTFAVLAVSWYTAQGLDSLIVGWFAFTGTELWMLGKIKRDKIGKDDSE